MRPQTALCLVVTVSCLVGVPLGGLATDGGQIAQVPPGHPPLGGTPRMPHVAPPPAGSGSGSAALAWTLPEGWIEEKPSSRMRRAQYRLPGPGGEGQCVVFYFGPGQGGSAMANAQRWASQFQQPDGRPSGDRLKTRRIDVGGIPVLLAEVTGTYIAGMPGGPAGPERPDYMLLGAIAEGPDANWFFKATGPQATLEAQRSAFEGMIHSLKPGE